MNCTWEGIDASSHQPQRVWFSKGPKDVDPWLPLRKCDCKALNKAFASTSESSFGSTAQLQEQLKVTIESGRATADLNQNIIQYNFYDAPVHKLSNAIWFQKDTSDKKKKLT